MASAEQRFNAAVNVIKGLPKNGPYQPSTAMMLQFYGYYKQATEGPCMQKKPAFWDVVGRAKWDAWNANRHLTKEQAMTKYVDNLREIIETMSFTENVADFVGSISSLDNINLDELDMIAPGMREMAETHPDSPFNSRTNSPHHNASTNGGGVEPEDESPSSSLAVAANAAKFTSLNGHYDHNNRQSSADGAAMLSNTLETQTQNTKYAISNGTVDQSDDEYADPVDMQNELSESIAQNSELLKQIQAAVTRMNADVIMVKQHVGVLERSVQDVRALSQKALIAQSRAQRWPKWWPFKDISPTWFALLIIWPFVVNRLSRMLPMQRRK